jgi:hypothetical protein
MGRSRPSGALYFVWRAQKPQLTALIPAGRKALLFFCLVYFSCGSLEALAEASAPQVNLPSQIGERIVECWQAPQSDQVIEVTVRLSFSSAGAVIGEPRITYIRAPAGPGFREKIAASILAAIRACTPLPFTPSLGAAIAGRMFAIRFSSLTASGKRRAV